MKLKYIITSVFVLATVLNVACSDRDNYTIPKGSFEEKPIVPPVKVETSKVDGKWRLLVDGQELYVKGAACNNFYAEAADFGANVVRTYGVSDKSKAILDAAQEKGLYVNFGLYIKRETDGFDYNNAAAVKAQFDEMKATVERFKDHPALLVWSIGNEAEASYTNLKLWDAINDIAKMIHETDPNHPTTTTLASSNVNH